MLKLSQFIDFTEMIRSNPYSEYEIWVNIKTDETECFDVMMEPADETDEFRHEGQPEWIRFRPEIYDSTIIEAFIGTIGDADIRTIMYDLFRGRGKYQRIKTYFARIGVLDRFYAYENEYVKTTAVDWCKRLEIPYRE